MTEPVSPPPTGRLPTEIEITPEMIDAGAWAFVTHDQEHFSLEEIVESIGRAMLTARRTEGKDSALPRPSPAPN